MGADTAVECLFVWADENLEKLVIKIKMLSIYTNLWLSTSVPYLAVQKQVLAATDQVEEMALCLEPGLSLSFFFLVLNPV